MGGGTSKLRENLSDGPRPAGGGGNFGGSSAPAADFQIPKEDIRAALGKKGRVQGIENALDNSNPFYSGAYADYSENCQRAVIAYELNRRGYNVMALPTYEGDRMPMSALRGNGYWQGAFRHAKSENVGASTRQAATRKLEQKMLSYGNGARAIVRVQSRTGGHVFNAEVRGGKVIYVDAQTNQRYDPKRVLAHVEPSRVSVVRTDNLRISYRAKEMVTPNIGVKNKRR